MVIIKGLDSRHLQQLLVDKLQRIDTLLEFDVFIGELGLVFGLSQLLLDQLLGTLRKRCEVRATRHKSKDGVNSTWSRTGDAGAA